MFRGLRIALMHGKAVLGAALHTVAALNATEPLDGPAFFRTVDRDGACRALFGTESAEDAGVNVVFNMAPCALRIYPFLLRVKPGGRLGK